VDLIKFETLPNVIEIILKLFGTTIGMFTFAVFALVFILVKVPQLPLVQWFNERKSKRLKFFQDHFSLITDDKFCKTVVEDVRNAIVFEHATKIYAERNWRKSLVELHDNTGVSWIVIKRAHRLMDIRLDGTVFIKDFTLFDKFDRIFNIFMAIFFSSSVFFLIIGLIYNPGFLSNLQALAFCLFSFSIATFSVFQNVPYYAATRLRNKLDLISQDCEYD
jgi:hypothetical protein